jgi:hypothetical protein
MSAFSNYLEDKIIGWAFNNAAFPTQLATVYVSLHTADPADTGANEVVVGGTNYQRVAVAAAGWTKTTAGTASATNNADITVKYHLSAAGAGTSIALANTITVPADSTLVIIGKDSPIYLEENRSLTAQATASDDIAIVCSYEDIS